VGEILNINELLEYGVKIKASDLHIAAGRPPWYRIDNVMHESSFPLLTHEDTKRMIYSLLSDAQKERFEESLELDISIHRPDLSRFRVNVHMQRSAIEAAIRIIPLEVKSFEELRLPPILKDIINCPTGLILVTGATGTGKSTTLASLVDHINSTSDGLIVCIEDPIEYFHQHKRCLVKQREVGSDTHSFSNGLRHALRQDPDVILVGEIRDLETITTALAAAETGHLVLSTLHTNDVVQTVDRLIDIFPPHQQPQVRIQLADCLQAIVSQRLLPRSGGGLIPAFEIMVSTHAIRSLIREHKTSHMASVIQTSGDVGMITMDKAVVELYQQKLIDFETAVSNVKDASCVKKEGSAEIIEER
jgi:twitching motility protein PilT